MLGELIISALYLAAEPATARVSYQPVFSCCLGGGATMGIPHGRQVLCITPTLKGWEVVYDHGGKRNSAEPIFHKYICSQYLGPRPRVFVGHVVGVCSYPPPLPRRGGIFHNEIATFRTPCDHMGWGLLGWGRGIKRNVVLLGPLETH